MSSTFALINYKVKGKPYSERVKYDTIKKDEKSTYSVKVLNEEYMCPDKLELIRVLTLYIRAITNSFVDEILVIL